MKLNINLIILLAITTLAANNKLINGEEETELIKKEIIQDQLIPLSNTVNLKETSLTQSIATGSDENELISLASAEDANKFQKAQAKLMSFKNQRKTYSASEETSKTDVAKNLNNALRISRLEMVKSKHPDLPKMLSYYLDKRNKDELRRLSKNNLLPESFKSSESKNQRLVEVPAFLKSKHLENHQRILNTVDRNSEDTIRKLSASRDESDKRYFLSSDYLENRLNNALRKSRLELIKNEGESETPVILANYLKRKVNNERNQLASKGIIVEDEEVEPQEVKRPNKNRKFQVNDQDDSVPETPNRLGKGGKLKDKLINKIKNKTPVEETTIAAEYETTEEPEETTTRKPKKQLLVIDGKNVNKPVNKRKPKSRYYQPENIDEYGEEEEEETIKFPVNKGRGQNRNNIANGFSQYGNYPNNYRRNPNNLNVNVNRPNANRRPVQQVGQEEEEEVPTEPPVKNNKNNRQNGRQQQQQQNLRVNENHQKHNNPSQAEEEASTEQNKGHGNLNRNYRNKSFRRKDSYFTTTTEASTTQASTTVEATTEALVTDQASTQASIAVPPTQATLVQITEAPLTTQAIELSTEAATTKAVSLATTTASIIEEVTNPPVEETTVASHAEKTTVNYEAQAQPEDDEWSSVQSVNLQGRGRQFRGNRAQSRGPRQRVTTTPAPSYVVYDDTASHYTDSSSYDLPKFAYGSRSFGRRSQNRFRNHY